LTRRISALEAADAGEDTQHVNIPYGGSSYPGNCPLLTSKGDVDITIRSPLYGAILGTFEFAHFTTGVRWVEAEH